MKTIEHLRREPLFNNSKLSPEAAVKNYISLMHDDEIEGIELFGKVHEAMVNYCKNNKHQRRFITWHLSLRNDELLCKLVTRSPDADSTWFLMFYLMINQLIFVLEGFFTHQDIQTTSEQFYNVLSKDFEEGFSNGVWVSVNGAHMLVDAFRILNYGLEKPTLFPSDEMRRIITEKLIISPNQLTPDRIEVFDQFRSEDKLNASSLFKQVIILDPYQKEPMTPIEALTERMNALENEVKELRSYIASKESSWSSKD